MLKEIIQTLDERGVRLVAVSKTHTIEKIQQAYDQGVRIFGENRVQEVVDKQALLPDDIQWHFIGHLQTNKVKLIAPFINLIHSIDSVRILREINKQAAKNQRVIEVLLQFKIAQEESKYGFDWSTAQQLLSSADFHAMKNIRIVGVMGMATFTDNLDQVRKEFKELFSLFTKTKNQYFADDEAFKEISMGMSGDYQLAIEEGSTMVRIGSLIFGSRH